MSSNSVVSNTGQQAEITTDLSKIFIWNNRYKSYPYNNSAYDSVTLLAGTLMGTVAGTGYIKPLASGASDGSQYPTGILAEDVTVDGGDLVDLDICVSGDVVEDKIIFQGSDNLDTTVSSRRLRDRIGADTVGIKLVTSTSNSSYDNL
ncbi:MAG: Bacteriophage lambda head decoration protein [Bacteroidetes bacterium]|jgi:hypothetical protein|nr:Bacteriophage lambda head decoration protein [Bacteroidota bacterium]